MSAVIVPRFLKPLFLKFHDVDVDAFTVTEKANITHIIHIAETSVNIFFNVFTVNPPL